MADDCAITHRLLANQRTMFRIAEAGFGFSQKAIHLLTGIGLTTVGQYARGETAMGGAAIMKISGIKDFPAELLCLLFAGTGRIVLDDHLSAKERLDYDDIALGALALAGEVQRARSENSPGGTEIVDCEKAKIHRHQAELAPKLRNVA